MKSLVDEMKKCKTVDDCISVATTDAYDEDEQASGWLTCMQDLFGERATAKVLDEEMKLEGFDLSGTGVVVKCRKGNKRARVALESVEFLKPSKAEELWLKAWKEWNRH